MIRLACCGSSRGIVGSVSSRSGSRGWSIHAPKIGPNRFQRTLSHRHPLPSKDIVRRRERWDQFRDGRTGIGTAMLISVLITFLVIILVLYLINMLPLDGRTKQIVRVIVIIIGVLSLLKYLTVF
jgi:hypothetical protein